MFKNTNHNLYIKTSEAFKGLGTATRGFAKVLKTTGEEFHSCMVGVAANIRDGIKEMLK